MSADDSSANIKKSPKQYHHGDLRSALVTGGLELLKERAADDLSLREVARHVGVSATAVYRHFPDKQSLLYAICKEGAEKLGKAQFIAMGGAGGGKKGFEASGRAYIYFALENPGLYRLMMSTRPPAGLYEKDGTAITGAMQSLHKNVMGILGMETDSLGHKVAKLHSWALMHGISMLILDGLVEPDGEVIDALMNIPTKAHAY